MKRLQIFLIIYFFSFSAFPQNPFFLTYQDQDLTSSFYTAIETTDNYFVTINSEKYKNDTTISQVGTVLKLSKQGEILKEKKIVLPDSVIYINTLIDGPNGISIFYARRVNSFIFLQLDNELENVSEKEYVFQNYQNRLIGFIKAEYNFDHSNLYLSGDLWDTVYIIPKEAFIMKFSPEGDSLDYRIFQRDTYINIFSLSSFKEKDTILLGSVESEWEHFLYIMNNNLEIVDSSSVSTMGTYGQDMLEGETELLSDSVFIYACDYQDDIYKTRLSSWNSDFEKTKEVFVWKEDSAVYTAFNNLEISADGNIFLGQTLFSSHDPFPGPYPTWFVLNKFDEGLNLIWQKYYGGDAYYKLKSITATTDGGCLLCGNKWNYETDNVELAILLKVDQDGNGPAINIEERNSIKTSDLIIYPNPGNENLNIRTAVQSIGGVFSLYDITGKCIFQTNINDCMTRFNIGTLPSGSYIYEYIDVEKKIESGKWIKL